MPGLLRKQREDALSVASRLIMNKDRILKMWDERVRMLFPETRLHSESALKNQLSELLDEFSQLLGYEDPAQAKTQASAVTRRHGVERAKFDKYPLNVLIAEYYELRKMIFEVLEEDGELPVREREILLEAIRRGVADSVTSYVEYQQKKILNYVDQLEEEHARREMFVMALTHDLKHPLTSLALNVDTLKRHPTADVITLAIPKLSESITQMDRMVTDLLDANLIHAGEKMRLEMSDCDLNDLVFQTVSDMKMIYGDRFSIAGMISGKGYWNADALRRAISNLLINAVKHGEEKLLISIVLSENENEVELSVHNRGPVLDSNQITQIFKPFRRFPAGAAQKKGWGLGLTIVRGITEAHHGRVVVESSSEAGTTFKLIFPKGFQNEKLPRIASTTAHGDE